VKLGYRRARVTVTREIWDATVRAWRIADDAVSVETIARDERELVTTAVRRQSGSPSPWSDPCAASACDPTGCLVASHAGP
jgi:hypothetical protein